MSALSRLGASALRRMDPERAHGLALGALRAGLGPRARGALPDALRTSVAGLGIAHPVGLAAGFDKNAQAVGPLLRAGFAFVEVGAVTPRPQPGNPRPRLFRLEEDAAAINRFGFNNDGMEAVAARLAARPKGGGPVGVNLGANKDAADRARDYATVLERLAGLADFFTVNVSSPNTAGLRDLQERAALDALVAGVVETRDRAAPGRPVLVKIAPDLSDDGLRDAVEVCLDRSVDGLIATNTTLSRDGLRSRHAGETGGLSGRPLHARSTHVLRRCAEIAQGALPLVGVGGVEDAATAYAKLRAGASCVQLYTALVWAGPGLAHEIARGLAKLLARDGYGSVAECVGADVPRSSAG